MNALSTKDMRVKSRLGTAMSNTNSTKGKFLRKLIMNELTPFLTDLVSVVFCTNDLILISYYS